MIGIVGSRGVGKTTMILQYIKENLGSKRALYVSADDMYFGENRLVDLADNFYKNAGEYLFIDEIHKYMDWSRELKNIYDSYPDLKIVFTGSSVLDILKGSSDLSRRALIYHLQGLRITSYNVCYTKLLRASLFPGEILLIYAMLSPVLFFVRHLSNRSLIYMALFFLLQPYLMYNFMGTVWVDNYQLPNLSFGHVWNDMYKAMQDGSYNFV